MVLITQYEWKLDIENIITYIEYKRLMFSKNRLIKSAFRKYAHTSHTSAVSVCRIQFSKNARQECNFSIQASHR